MRRARVAGFVAIMGCSSSTGSPIAIDDFPRALVEADCAVAVRCHVISDTGLCMSFIGSSLDSQAFNSFGAVVATVKAGKSRYDGATARVCLDKLRGASCSSTVAPAECQHIFTGTVPDGERCINDVACTPGSFCGLPTVTTPCDGTCMAGGTLCNNDDHCTAGMFCDRSRTTGASNGQCAQAVPPGGQGQPCGTNSTCATGLACGPDGVCGPAAAEGQPCPCADGLLCASSAGAGLSGVCVAPAAKGEACVDNIQCGGFLSSFACDPSSHVCVDLPSSGPCLSGFSPCAPLTSFCDENTSPPTCRPFATAGASCSPLNAGECGGVLANRGLACVSTDGSIGTCTAVAAPVVCAP